MKIQIDTKNKILKPEDDIKLSELIKNLKKLFPNNEWKDYILETNTTIQSWNNPIIIKEYVEVEKTQPYNPYPYNPYPWNLPTYMSGTNTIGECQSIYNVEC